MLFSFTRILTVLSLVLVLAAPCWGVENQTDVNASEGAVVNATTEAPLTTAETNQTQAEPQVDEEAEVTADDGAADEAVATAEAPESTGEGEDAEPMPVEAAEESVVLQEESTEEYVTTEEEQEELLETPSVVAEGTEPLVAKSRLENAFEQLNDSLLLVARELDAARAEQKQEVAEEIERRLDERLASMDVLSERIDSLRSEIYTALYTGYVVIGAALVLMLIITMARTRKKKE